MAGLGTFLLEFGVDNDGLQKDLNKGLSQIERFGRSIENVATKLSIGISAPLGLLAKKAIEAYGELEALKLSLGTIERTADSLTSRLAELNEVAKLPGIGFKEAIQADVRLRAVGISADIAKRSMLAFGNAIATAGGGKAQFDSVIYQLTQMSAKAKVLSQDFRPIIEAVPAVAQAVKKLYGTVDTEVIQDKMKKLGMGSQQFIEQIIGELEKLPKVTGGVKNAIENLSDTFFKSFAKIGETIDKNVGIQKWVDQIGKFAEQAAESFANLSPEAQKAVIAIGGLAIVVPPLLALAGTVIPAIGTALVALTGPAGIAAAALIAAAGYAVTHWEKVSKTIDEVGDSLERNALTLRFYAAQFRQGLDPAGAAKELGGIMADRQAYLNKKNGVGQSVVDSDSYGKGFGINDIKTISKGGGGFDPEEAAKQAKKIEKIRQDLLESAQRAEVAAIQDSSERARAEALRSYAQDLKDKKASVEGKKSLEDELNAYYYSRHLQLLKELRDADNFKTPSSIKSLGGSEKEVEARVYQAFGISPDGIERYGQALKEKAKSFMAGLENSANLSSGNNIIEGILGLNAGTVNGTNFEMYEKQALLVVNANNQISESFTNLKANAIASIGEMVGQMIAGTATVADLGRSILGTIAQSLAEIAKIKIFAGIATGNVGQVALGLFAGIGAGIFGGLSKNKNNPPPTSQQPAYSVVRGGDIFTANNRYQVIKGY